MCVFETCLGIVKAGHGLSQPVFPIALGCWNAKNEFGRHTWINRRAVSKFAELGNRARVCTVVSCAQSLFRALRSIRKAGHSAATRSIAASSLICPFSSTSGPKPTLGVVTDCCNRSPLCRHSLQTQNLDEAELTDRGHCYRPTGLGECSRTLPLALFGGPAVSSGVWWPISVRRRNRRRSSQRRSFDRWATRLFNPPIKPSSCTALRWVSSLGCSVSAAFWTPSYIARMVVMFELQLAEMQPPAPSAIACASSVSEAGKTDMPGWRRQYCPSHPSCPYRPPHG